MIDATYRSGNWTEVLEAYCWFPGVAQATATRRARAEQRQILIQAVQEFDHIMADTEFALHLFGALYTALNSLIKDTEENHEPMRTYVRLTVLAAWMLLPVGALCGC